MDPADAMEAPLCTWDNETGILTTPKDNQIDGILSNLCRPNIWSAKFYVIYSYVNVYLICN